MLRLGTVVMGAGDVERATAFWADALGYGTVLVVDDAAEQVAEVDRLLGLGATRVDRDAYPADPDFVVLADPEGNRFCVVDAGHD